MHGTTKTEYIFYNKIEMKNGTIPKTKPNQKNTKLSFKIDFYLFCMLELLEENQRSTWKLVREAEGNLKAFS